MDGVCNGQGCVFFRSSLLELFALCMLLFPGLSLSSEWQGSVPLSTFRLPPTMSAALLDRADGGTSPQVTELGGGERLALALLTSSY